jgi:hypothetical protein
MAEMTRDRMTPVRERRHERPAPDYVEIDVDALPARDRVRWGPILAGIVTALTTLVVLTVLGVGLGLSAFEPGADGATTSLGTAAGIWGAATALAAFLIGGFVAGGTAGVRVPGSGALNGFLMGAAAIALTLWLVGSGIGNVLGVAAANLNDLSSVNVTITGAEAQDAFATAEESAWWTLLGLGAALFAAAVGGWLGELSRTPVDERR